MNHRDLVLNYVHELEKKFEIAEKILELNHILLKTFNLVFFKIINLKKWVYFYLSFSLIKRAKFSTLL